MPSHIFDDPKHWRGRAEEARTLAKQMNDTASREMMLGIAKDYERLAERAEQRAQEKGKSTEAYSAALSAGSRRRLAPAQKKPRPRPGLRCSLPEGKRRQPSSK